MSVCFGWNFISCPVEKNLFSCRKVSTLFSFSLYLSVIGAVHIPNCIFLPVYNFALHIFLSLTDTQDFRKSDLLCYFEVIKVKSL